MSFTSSYLDVDVGNTSQIVFNSEAFLNKIDNILATPYNSIPFYRVFGTDLEKYLFRAFSYSSATLISMEIENSIRRFYPEATVIVNLTDLDYNSRSYPLTITISHPRLLEPLTIKKSYQSYV